jgi:glyoxylase-like metal-dependent hydrolase (beta-lactamase superfamily II)
MTLTAATTDKNAELAIVTPFFDEPTSTLSYVVQDPASSACAVIDSVMNLDYPSGTISFEGADRIIAFIKGNNLQLEWLLETHVHADHLSAAPYIQAALGGKIAIGSAISVVQETFGQVFNEDAGFARDGSQFDVLLSDNQEIRIGGLSGVALHTPGHTPACMTYVLGDAIFVGDTLFMPDAGTARADFPGGDAAVLFESIGRILSLDETLRIFVCHDYQPDERELEFETTVAEQKSRNIHVHEGITQQDFVKMRETRDRTLGMPNLILPSLQVNMRAGHIPPVDSDQRLFLKLPLNAFGGADLTAVISREK